MTSSATPSTSTQTLSIPVSDPNALPGREGVIAPCARFLAHPERFFVDEIESYPASGEGEHLFVHIRKQHLTTKHLSRMLQQALDIKETDIGYAGLKDRHATTTQWLSLAGIAPEQLESLALDGVDILTHCRHHHKLRVGHLRGNRFRVLLEGLKPGALELVRQRLVQLETLGVPNFFGPQRFGHGGRNREQGRDMVQGKFRVKAPWKRKFLISAYQSALFNDLLAYRVSLGLLDTVQAGDWLKKHESGGSFQCQEPEVDQERAAQMELSPTGVMMGHKVAMADGVPGSWERAILEREGLALDGSSFRPFRKFALGTRRFLRVLLQDVVLEGPEDDKTLTADQAWLSFVLPSGAYATIVLQQLGVSVEEQPDSGL